MGELGGVDERQRILLVDDEQDNLDLLVRTLRSVGPLRTATNGADALQILRDESFAAVVTDHAMPGLTGVELLERAARLSPHTQRILVSAYGDVDMLTEAINRGHVSHFLPKPIDPAKLRSLVEEAIGAVPIGPQRAVVLATPELSPRVAQALRAAGLGVLESAELGGTGNTEDVLVWNADLSAAVLDRIRRALLDEDRFRRHRTHLGLCEMLGRSPAMRAMFDAIERVAPTDASILVRGETGTGKELVARVAHALSHRRDQPFVAVNCAALPEALVESEMFGHERGAYTGAQARKLGRFERADGGTLFIDEVGNMPEAVQVKLLRVLQERSFERVGGTKTLHVDIRLIAATNLDLEAAMTQGQFREDLFYRLNVVPITLPPLRERREDIGLLIEHMLPMFQRRLGKEGIRLSPSMLGRLHDYHWPGNVRELMNVMERVVALTPSGGVADFPDIRMRAPRQRLAVMIPEQASASLREMVGDFERRVIAQSLERHQGNRSRAARELGITRQGLSVKIRKYDL
ncbi:MAG TPA: sigma-54 dependent transcriptional regulator [Kofleriaceae bacterium]|nr:sigma-54 dependent transcriptional regulator [Kofleriaceae bacterium]